jgi:hypothetical protein
VRLLVAGVLIALVVGLPLWTASAADRPVTYSLYGSYPNFRQVKSGYFLRGTNRYRVQNGSTMPARTSLWFERLGAGTFKQFATAPYGECHADLLRWGAGPEGLLVYLSTDADCYSDHTRITFSPGIAYMPKTWVAGEQWRDRGVAQTVYADNGVPVCTGSNTWVSSVVGLVRMPGGVEAVHTQTDETQSLSPIAGAPPSGACPPGPATTFEWQENYYLATPIDVRTTDGALSGTDAGLARSVGGNPAVIRATGHPEWDSVFAKWLQLPPLNVGTLTTSTSTVANGSSGNTISFTYTAPATGLDNGVLRITVPPDWTPPVTTNGPGCTASTAGTLSTSGQLIRVSGLDLPGNGQAVISYGSTSGGACAPGDGATASTTPGAPVWRAEVHAQGEPFTNFVDTPAIDVGPGNEVGTPAPA